MPIEVIMPKVDMDMASGKVLVWHVAPGDAVSKGEPLFDIETDKAAMEVESPGDGILHHTVDEGTVVAIGEPVAWIYTDDEVVTEPPRARAVPEKAPVSIEASAPDETAAKPDEKDTAGPDHEQIRATPRARVLAREEGLDISRISGSGPRGRVQAYDVRASLDAKGPASAAQLPAGFPAEAGPLAVSRSKGGKGTPVLFIHGFASDATSWAPLEASLRHRPLIRIDLPCHGKSPRLRVSDFGELAGLIRRAFDDLGFERAHLVGHSLGGALSLALADTRPRQIEGVTLIAPAGLGPEINGDVLAGIGRASRQESLAPWLKALVHDETLITASYVRDVMAKRNAPEFRAAQLAMAEVLFPDGTQSFDLKPALDRLEAPARIVWGKQDCIIPWQHALRAPGRVGLHFFDKVGHMPQIEIAEELGNLIGRE